MKKALHGIFFLMAIGFGSCSEKDPPQAVHESADLLVTGLLNGKPLNVLAGENGYAQHTDITVDSAGVTEFVCEFRKDCDSCGEKLKIVIRNYAASTAGFSPELAFHEGNYLLNYQGVVSNSWLLNFTSNATGQGNPTHHWDFGDGTTSDLPNPVKEFKSGGSYKVSYSVSYPNGCSSTLAYPVNASPYIDGLNNSDIGYTQIADHNIRLFSTSTAPFMIWLDGTDVISTQPECTIHLDEGVKTISLKKVSGEDTVLVCRNIPAANYLLCNAGFSHFARSQSDPLRLGTMVITYTDAGGHAYTSLKAKQSGNSFFRVNASSNYFRDDQNRATQKISFESNCLLSDGLNTITLHDMKGSAAFAHP